MQLSNGTHVTFTDTFTLNGTPISASLQVLADDTTSVVLNGTTIFPAYLTGNPLDYPQCAAFPIGCMNGVDGSTLGSFSFSQLGPYLHPGTNTLSFTVYQEKWRAVWTRLFWNHNNGERKRCGTGVTCTPGLRIGRLGDARSPYFGVSTSQTIN